MKTINFTAIVLAALLFAGSSDGQTAKPPTKETIQATHLAKYSKEKQNCTVSILVDKDPQMTFDAIKNFRGWWSEEIEGKTDQIGEVFVYHYKDIHISKMKLAEAVPGKKLVYQVLDNQFSFTKDKSEWIGTKLIFDISSQGGKTRVKFTHEGLVPEYECYKVCHDAWDNYIKSSLYNFITTGKGQPNPKDKDGFNAELAEKWKIN
jgi:hypothetical protein